MIGSTQASRPARSASHMEAMPISMLMRLRHRKLVLGSQRSRMSLRLMRSHARQRRALSARACDRSCSHRATSASSASSPPTRSTGNSFALHSERSAPSGQICLAEDVKTYLLRGESRYLEELVP